MKAIPMSFSDADQQIEQFARSRRSEGMVQSSVAVPVSARHGGSAIAAAEQCHWATFRPSASTRQHASVNMHALLKPFVLLPGTLSLPGISAALPFPAT